MPASEVSRGHLSVGQELGPFPYSTDGAGEGNYSLLSKKNVLLLNSHFLASTSLLQEVFRQNGGITKHCVSSRGVWGAVTAAGPITRSPKLFFIPHFTLVSCHRTQVSSLQPSCHVGRWPQSTGWWEMRLLLGRK